MIVLQITALVFLLLWLGQRLFEANERVRWYREVEEWERGRDAARRLR